MTVFEGNETLPGNDLLPAFDPRFGDVLVLGLGRSGVGVARFVKRALDEGNPVASSLAIYAGKGTDAVRANAVEFEQAGIPVVFDVEDIEGRYDTCITSPGIPAGKAFYRSAREHSGQVISEPEMAYLLSPRNWIAVTGTNGKTTTTSLTAHLLKEAGFAARAVGNIGDPCIDAVCDRREGEYFVAELSSFQLQSTCRFSPRVGILLNITPDHVEWHGSFESYRDAKMKLFDNLEFDSLAVFDVTDAQAALCASLVEDRGRHVLSIDPRSDGAGSDRAGVRDGRLFVSLTDIGTVDLCSVDELPIKGDHNIANALAAASAALFVGADASHVTRGLVSFAPLEHRNEHVATVGGVEYYNDSKATNVDATLKALHSFPGRPLIALLGGHDKGTPLDDLVSSCRETCAAVVCYGEAAGRFLDAFGGENTGEGLVVRGAAHMADALQLAGALSTPGYVVCLTPACSSFDEFTSYEERGTVFKRLVQEMGASIR